MTSPYPHRTHINRRQVLHEQLEVPISAATTIQSTLSLPPSGWAIGMTVAAHTSLGTVTITAGPWIDHEQTIQDGQYKFLATGGTTATTNITMAATGSVRGWSGMVIPAGDQYGAAAPIMAVHGSQLTITAAGTVANLVVAYTAMEL